MTNEAIKQVRTLNRHVGRLAAIKYLRAGGLPHLVAKMAVEDITTNKPWTKPRIKADLNWWEPGFEPRVSLAKKA
jgi:hypothetical protein